MSSMILTFCKKYLGTRGEPYKKTNVAGENFENLVRCHRFFVKRYNLGKDAEPGGNKSVLTCGAMLRREAFASVKAG